MSVPKENKILVRNEIPNQKISNFFRFLNKTFTTCQILNRKIYNMSDFEIKNLKRVRFCEKIFYFKVSPNSTTYNFHNVFLHKTMYNYSLHYLLHLFNKIRHRSNNISCSHFRKDFEF